MPPLLLPALRLSYAILSLLKLLRPALTIYIDSPAKILEAVHGAVKVLEDVAINAHHTPALHAQLLRSLLSSTESRPNSVPGTPYPAQTRQHSPAPADAAAAAAAGTSDPTLAPTANGAMSVPGGTSPVFTDWAAAFGGSFPEGDDFAAAGYATFGTADAAWGNDPALNGAEGGLNLEAIWPANSGIFDSHLLPVRPGRACPALRCSPRLTHTYSLWRPLPGLELVDGARGRDRQLRQRRLVHAAGDEPDPVARAAHDGRMRRAEGAGRRSLMRHASSRTARSSVAVKGVRARVMISEVTRARVKEGRRTDWGQQEAVRAPLSETGARSVGSLRGRTKRTPSGTEGLGRERRGGVGGGRTWSSAAYRASIALRLGLNVAVTRPFSGVHSSVVRTTAPSSSRRDRPAWRPNALISPRTARWTAGSRTSDGSVDGPAGVAPGRRCLACRKLSRLAGWAMTMPLSCEQEESAEQGVSLLRGARAGASRRGTEAHSVGADRGRQDQVRDERRCLVDRLCRTQEARRVSVGAAADGRSRGGGSPRTELLEREVLPCRSEGAQVSSCSRARKV